MTDTAQKPATKPADSERGISEEDRRDRDREAAEGPLPRPRPAEAAADTKKK